MNSSNLPRITVVTPSFNQGHFLEETIRSVLDQGYPNLEYMVIDGGSTDQSVSIIKRYADRLDYWVSEPDRGQTHAIQKGLDRATGEIFNWINSDDLLAPQALHTIAANMVDSDALGATTVNFGDGGERRFVTRNLDAWSIIAESLGTRARWHQPGIWLRTDQLRSIGPLEQSLSYRFDMDMLTRYLAKFPEVNYLDQAVARFRMHAESKTSTAAEGFRAEHYEVIRRARRLGLFPGRQEELERLEQTMQWQDRLKEILAESDRGRFGRARQILREANALPAQVRRRYTSKYLKRVLLRGQPH